LSQEEEVNEECADSEDLKFQQKLEMLQRMRKIFLRRGGVAITVTSDREKSSETLKIYEVAGFNFQ
jgi:hypothetical protein